MGDETDMIVPPVNLFPAKSVTRPAPPGEMSQPDITHGNIGESGAIGAIGRKAAWHGGGGTGGEGEESERDQGFAC
jgi:hypothetical protein